MNVLSLFDGMSCGQIALNRAGIKYDNYFASEIDKNAIKVTKTNYPNTIHIGDVTKVSYKDGILETETGCYKVGIDLVIGGSPCQSFSIASTNGKKDYKPPGLEGKSRLFYEYLRILKEVEDCNSEVKWLLENVKMSENSKLQLDTYLGVCGVYINSNLVSFQNRSRYYWSNIPFSVPSDKGIDFQNHKEEGDLSMYKLNPTPSRIKMWSNGVGRNNSAGCANVTHARKIYCLTTKQDRAPNSGLVEYEDFCRYLTRQELEQAQTVPIGYTDCLSYGQMQSVLGNGWTVDVIAHIFKGLKEIK